MEGLNALRRRAILTTRLLLRIAVADVHNALMQIRVKMRSRSGQHHRLSCSVTLTASEQVDEADPPATRSDGCQPKWADCLSPAFVLKSTLPHRIDTLSDSSPYLPPHKNETADSDRNLQMPVLRAVCAYGLFANLWYLGAIALYFMVYGDNSSTFGLYPVLPAAVVAVAVVWTFRNARTTLCVLAGLTAPLGLLFAYNAIRFGLF